MKHRVYIDTSVIGGCFDKEFEQWSNKLLKEISDGLKIAVLSDITYREMELAPKRVQHKLLSIPKEFVENIQTNEEVMELAQNYVDSGTLSPNWFEDALHIANATITKLMF